MSPNGSNISIVNSDPSWATMHSSAARFNRPDVAGFLRQQTKYRPGDEFRKAGLKSISDELTAIREGRAETEPQPIVRQKPTNQEAIDFDSPVGMIAEIKGKADALPSNEVFMPIVSGIGTISPAAVDTWRDYITTNSLALGTTSRGLDRGISR